ncbi:para-aminobenzoate synthetase [Thalassolituus maritimus]|uniref:aminodeoxychorismate synthase n=1 Tax=Thalassolituus maritimus TaxID=484498 RepID=A0A1N7Q9A4_9GAMM|nr:aminodeoxychorismate synthase component I [Thalassolituus maritimus]SIT19329.1 para-aminobenzoate synthetase [Thalassolituus maritimus]
MKTLIIDNYDSFTYNLFQLIGEVNGTLPIVIQNDKVSWEEAEQLDFDNIVISPGPGRPENAGDFGVSRDAILHSKKPILGVCLGHQGIAHLFGGEVDLADTVMHGRASEIHHSAEDIFSGIPSPFTAIRYHSLCAKTAGNDMETIAWTDSGMSMGARHKHLPIWSVQFHPESIKTQFGHKIFENFRDLSQRYLEENPSAYNKNNQSASRVENRHTEKNLYSSNIEGGRLHGKSFKVFYRRIPHQLNCEDVFMNFYAESKNSFWLDSALVRGFSRFSYIGDAAGPHAEYLSYRVTNKELTIKYQDEVTTKHESILDYLDQKLKTRYIETEGLPFDFNLGYVGYLGYEIKADCGYSSPHASPTPDAAFVFCDRIIAFDHEENTAYLVCLDDEDHYDRAEQWLNDISSKLDNMQAAPHWTRSLKPSPIKQTMRLDKDEYLDRINKIKAKIKQGESYEVCLTNMLFHDVEIDPLNTYRALRDSNPAPYATYLNYEDVSVLSSSPERFIAINANGSIESKPIKGTRKRGASVQEDEALYLDLKTNEKDRSENLMIVDLLRNDIGKVSDLGSVHVHNIFAVESYATVHQLVSTVRGKLRRSASTIDCIRACFPGGSMTGAPKKRTMEIIDDLEGGARGIYSGSIGFIGLNGSADFSIAIRTIVVYGDNVTVGVGGAIIDLSNQEEELEEMLLKSRALVKALSETNLAATSFYPKKATAILNEGGR